MNIRQTPNRPTHSTPRSIPVSIAVCFFLSGLAGLVYEVVWARQLGLFLGITSYAHAAVITAYMAGLAAGSVFFGRRADRHPRPLILYAWLELLIGAYAAITPWLLPWLQTIYAGSADVALIGEPVGHVERLGIALVALLFPTFLMGGTLPLLVRGYTTNLPDLGGTTSRLYGINTLGAVSGTLLAGFLLLPAVGVSGTIYVGVVINLAIAIFVLAKSRSTGSDNGDSAVRPIELTRMENLPATKSTAAMRKISLFAFAIAGFAALLAQLAWIRALILVVGGSVYAFTITLASFLTGIGLGSLLYAHFNAAPVKWRPATILRERTVQAALLAALTSLTLLLGLPLIAKSPGWFMAAYSAGLQETFLLFQLFIFALSVGVMILPTLLMGALFPLVTVICTPSADCAGRAVGSAYAMNTAGTILGTLLGGILVLPWLGTQDSIRLAAGLYLLVAAVFWLQSRAWPSVTPRFATVGGVVGILAATAWLVPPWDKTVMMSGVFHRPTGIQRSMQQQAGRSLEEILNDYELLYFEEGADATVAVRRMRGTNRQRTLVINGKADASSSADMPTQVLLAQLPLALKPEADNALVIGLGSGITAGSLATSNALRKLTVLEISKQVIEASAFFNAENYGVLDDPKVKLVTADARNYLMASPVHYDLIVSEPSNPWISGIANLFTDEFLKLAKSRLRPDGILTQWFHTYSMADEDLKTMLKTFDDNFEYVSVWQMRVGDLALIGSDQPHALSFPYATSTAAGELTRANVHNERDLADLFVFGGDVLSRYVQSARINSDERPVVEFSAPRNLYEVTEFENMDLILAYLRDEQQDLPITGLVTRTDDGLSAPFMGLAIDDQDAPPVNVHARWIIDQPGRPITQARRPSSQRLLAWREGKVDYLVRAVFLDEVERNRNLQELLEVLKSSTGKQGSQSTLADGTPVIWLIGATADTNELELDIAWDCNSTTASRFALNAKLPSSEDDGLRQHLDQLANRIRCTPSN